MLLVHEDSFGSLILRRARLGDRLSARIRAGQLDARLAAGRRPESSAAMAVRAQLLVRPRTRRGLASGLERVLATAMRPCAASRLPPGIRSEQVGQMVAEIRELIALLLAPEPVPAQGVAQVRLLIGDARSPLYRLADRSAWAPGDNLPHRIHSARAALSAS